MIMQAHKATCRSSNHARTIVRVQEVWGVVAGGGVPTMAAVPQLLGLLNGLRKALLELLQAEEKTPGNSFLGRHLLLQGCFCCC